MKLTEKNAPPFHRVYKIYGMLPVGQRLHLTEVRRFAYNSYELGAFWTASAVLDGGSFAGHVVILPSGSDFGMSQAWITESRATGPVSHKAPPIVATNVLKPCDG